MIKDHCVENNIIDEVEEKPIAETAEIVKNGNYRARKLVKKLKELAMLRKQLAKLRLAELKEARELREIELKAEREKLDLELKAEANKEAAPFPRKES